MDETSTASVSKDLVPWWGTTTPEADGDTAPLERMACSTQSLTFFAVDPLLETGPDELDDMVSTLVQNPHCQQCLNKKFYYDNHFAHEKAHAPCDNAVSCALVGTNECSRTDIFPAHVQKVFLSNFLYYIFDPSYIENTFCSTHRIVRFTPMLR